MVCTQVSAATRLSVLVSGSDTGIDFAGPAAAVELDNLIKQVEQQQASALRQERLVAHALMDLAGTTPATSGPADEARTSLLLLWQPGSCMDLTVWSTQYGVWT